MRSLVVLPEASVLEQLDASLEKLIERVEDAYLAHWQARSVCPHSMFLRFPDRPRDRIIALPGYVRLQDSEIAGIKWIASFPDNPARGLRRASALIILNDLTTGYPAAVMEGAAISAYRTAASAALAARRLAPQQSSPRIGVIGAGRISLTTVRFLKHVYGGLSSLRIYDVLEDRKLEMARTFSGEFCPDVTVASSVKEALGSADIAIFATTAATPHVTAISDLGACRLVLHISLRDLSPEVLDKCSNVVDDPEHVLRERTSLHLQALANPEHHAIWGGLGDFIWGHRPLPADRPVVFSPFGLGVLDVAVAQYVLDRARQSSHVTEIPNFFGR